MGGKKKRATGSPKEKKTSDATTSASSSCTPQSSAGRSLPMIVEHDDHYEYDDDYDSYSDDDYGNTTVVPPKMVPACHLEVAIERTEKAYKERDAALAEVKQLRLEMKELEKRFKLLEKKLLQPAEAPQKNDAATQCAPLPAIALVKVDAAVQCVPPPTSAPAAPPAVEQKTSPVSPSVENWWRTVVRKDKAEATKKTGPTKKPNPATEKKRQPVESAPVSATPSALPEKRKCRRGSRGRKRSEVVRITPTTGKTFHDVYVAVRKGMTQEVQQMIKPTRRGNSEAMVIRCRRGANTELIEATVKAALGESGRVAVSVPMTCVGSNAMDYMATAEEVKAACLQQLGVDIALDQIRLGGTRGCTRSVRIRVPVKEAGKLMERRLCVGMTAVRLEEVQRKERDNERCYRCMQLGHRAFECKGADRSGQCFRCGAKGHQAFACREAARCLDCGEGHQTGSPRCQKEKTVERAATKEVAPSRSGANDNQSEISVRRSSRLRSVAL